MLKILSVIYMLWGFNWVVMKEANLFFSPTMFVALRFAGGAIALLATAAWLKLPLPPRPYWKWIAVTGILQIAVNNLAIQIGVVALGAGLAAVLNYSMPVWVAIMAHFILNERLTVRKLGGIAVSMAGLLILMKVDVIGSTNGILITLGGAVAWAAASILMKIQGRVITENQRNGRRAACHIIQYTAWQMVVGSLSLFAYMAISPPPPAVWTPLAAACLLYNCLFASALAFFLWNHLLTLIEASTASTAVLGVPDVGVLGGVICFGEPLTPQIAIGMVMILAGIVTIVRAPATK